MKKKIQKGQSVAERFMQGEDQSVICTSVGNLGGSSTNGWHGILLTMLHGAKVGRSNPLAILTTLLRRLKRSSKWCD